MSPERIPMAKLSCRNFGPSVIFVLGGPGAGKGTQRPGLGKCESLPGDVS